MAAPCAFRVIARPTPTDAEVQKYMHQLIPEVAILKAVEGGWLQGDLGYQYEGYNPVSPAEVYFQSFVGGELQEHTIALTAVALDPSFFQALGKALGWDKNKNLEYTLIADAEVRWIRMGQETELPAIIDRHNEENRMKYRIHEAIKDIEARDWKYHAQCFYDLILTGGSTDEFWDDLLK